MGLERTVGINRLMITSWIKKPKAWPTESKAAARPVQRRA